MWGPAVLDVTDLRTWFRTGTGPFGTAAVQVRAVDGISFGVSKGEVLGLVGESGSGKTTVGRSILRLVEPTSGSVRFKGANVRDLRGQALRRFRREAQIVFQDPFSSLNPRMKIERTVAEPLLVHGLVRGRRARRDRVAELLNLVGLAPEHMGRLPHEFSGGQRQRIAIARALALEPEFVVADEPVSALDVSIQAQVVNLLRQLKLRLGLTMLFIAHDLAVVEYIADRIAVMYLGKVMEIAPAKQIVRTARHPYTRALLSAVPVADPSVRHERTVLEGDIPSAIAPPSGCVFRTRCPHAGDRCAGEVPALRQVGVEHQVACIRDDLH
jgi:oligopeptide transport system ATP-binding protein